MGSIGIVGSEAAKFTPTTEQRARQWISDLIAGYDTVVSGACHLGGIDLWAAEIGHASGLEVIEYRPAVLSWENGYKPRNLQIAQRSDKVVCITVKVLPPGYTGMRFKYCYHCGTDQHVKSGGCWTVKQAAKMGKDTGIICI